MRQTNHFQKKKLACFRCLNTGGFSFQFGWSPKNNSRGRILLLNGLTSRTHWSPPRTLITQQSKESGRGGKIESNTNNLFPFFSFRFVVTNWKAIRGKGSEQMKVGDEADGTVFFFFFFRFLAFDVGPFTRKALVRLAKKIVGRRP